jgi:hypothetical protein
VSDESREEEGPGSVCEVLGSVTQATEETPGMVKGHQDHNNAPEQVHAE